MCIRASVRIKAIALFVQGRSPFNIGKIISSLTQKIGMGKVPIL